MKLTLKFPKGTDALHCIARLIITPARTPFFFTFISDGEFRIEIGHTPLSVLLSLGILDGLEYRPE